LDDWSEVGVSRCFSSCLTPESLLQAFGKKRGPVQRRDGIGQKERNVRARLRIHISNAGGRLHLKKRSVRLCLRISTIVEINQENLETTAIERLVCRRSVCVYPPPEQQRPMADPSRSARRVQQTFFQPECNKFAHSSNTNLNYAVKECFGCP